MPDQDGTPDLEGAVAPTLATIDAKLLPAPTSSSMPSIQPRQGSMTSSKAVEGSRRRVGIPSFPEA